MNIEYWFFRQQSNYKTGFKMTNIPGGFRIENIAPILNVKNLDQSLSFYVDLLGFKKADWGDNTFTNVTRDNVGIYLCRGGQGCESTWIWIGFDGDIFSLHESLKSKGVIIKLPPTNFSWAYEMQVEDPDGHVIRLGKDPDDKIPFASLLK